MPALQSGPARTGGTPEAGQCKGAHQPASSGRDSQSLYLKQAKAQLQPFEQTNKRKHEAHAQQGLNLAVKVAKKHKHDPAPLAQEVTAQYFPTACVQQGGQMRLTRGTVILCKRCWRRLHPNVRRQNLLTSYKTYSTQALPTMTVKRDTSKKDSQPPLQEHATRQGHSWPQNRGTTHVNVYRGNDDNESHPAGYADICHPCELSLAPDTIAGAWSCEPDHLQPHNGSNSPPLRTPGQPTIDYRPSNQRPAACNVAAGIQNTR